jgi:DNA-directed RNA polymerase subunit K/omega
METEDFVVSGGVDADDVKDVLEELDEFDTPEDDVVVEETEKSMFSNPIDVLLKYHPECILEYEETEQSSIPLRATLSEDDPKHRSAPFLSIFEKTKILGMRTNQLAQGARPYIQVPEHISDIQEIARMEIEQRRLPIIIKRFMPDGTSEKFRLSDMLII